VAHNLSRTIRIQWVRSGIGFSHRQKEIIRSLGLRRLNQVVERPDTPQIRGLVAKVSHLVTIVEESPVPAWESVAEYTVRPRDAVGATGPIAPMAEATEAERAPAAQEAEEESEEAERAAADTAPKTT
jgi:large subunit ribosomal protein L30